MLGPRSMDTRSRGGVNRSMTIKKTMQKEIIVKFNIQSANIEESTRFT